MSERARATCGYFVGYGLALALTGAAFAAARWPDLGGLSGRGLFGAVLGLGLVQTLVHFRFFLHISLKRSSRHDLLLILFSSLIMTLMVSGTLVILFNLRQRMM